MPLLIQSPETYRSVTGLRVVRAYTSDPIPADTLESILDAGRWTGSSKNVQGWHFVVVDGQQLEVLASAGKFTDPVRNSAITIALVESPEGNPFDIGRAAQNLMLAAAALGIGSCPVTLHDRDRAVEVLALPEGFECRWVVALGVPYEEGEERLREARRSGGMWGRKPLEEVVHHQRFGN